MVNAQQKVYLLQTVISVGTMHEINVMVGQTDETNLLIIAAVQNMFC